ncbi:MAG: GAF domain-containing protein [Spirochaeta sp.]|nr:GAF domain-containing protein [Spirochaeta sp.]
MAEAKSKQLLHNLSLLLEINSILNSAVSMDQVLQSIARGLVDVFGYGGSLVFEHQEDEGPVLTIKAFAYNYGSETIERIEKLLGFPLVGYQFHPETGGLFHRFYSEHQAVLSNNVTVLVAGMLHSTGKMKLAPVITRLLKIKSVIVYPLVVKERTIGVLVVAAQKQMRREDLELVRAFADQAAIAMERAHLYEKEHRLVSELTILRSVANSISTSLDLDDILTKAARLMVEHFNIDHCGILAFDADFEMSRVLAEYPDRSIIGQTFPIKGYGAAERIIEVPEPLFIEDTRTNPLMTTVREAMVRMDIGSMLILPLVIKGRTIGSIGLDSIGKQCTFRDKEINLAQAIADQVAIALENGRLFAEEHHQRQINETLREITQAVGSSLDPDDVLRMILQELKKVIDYQGGAILLIDEKERLLYVRMLEGYGKDAKLVTLPLDSDKGITVEVARTGEPLYVPDVSQDERYINIGINTGSELAVPLKIKERVIGILNVETDKIDAYSKEDLRLLTTFANQSAVALENARYYESIRLSEERFSHIAENIGDWVWEIDNEGRYTYCNSVVTSILGYTPEEMMGRPLYDFAIESEYEKIKNWAEQFPEKPETFNNALTSKLHRQGNTVILKSRGTPLLDASGEVIGFRGVNQDITRELQLEEQLRQAQKLESLGTLAGGIAHDFNNILGGMLGYASLIKEELPAGSDLLAEIETIITLAKRAAELTGRLLAFARKGHYQLVPVDLNGIVNEVVQLLLRTIDKAVAVKTSLRSSLDAVMGDSGQISQMLLNLCLNGCEAMPAGGRLLIKTENIVIDNIGEEALAELEAGSYVKLTVSDTGMGIEPYIQERIFDPFFTTKEGAGGVKHSGLGLAMVFGIVKSHGGAVKLESEKGKGSAFSIYLPCTEKNIQIGREKEKRVPEGKETILVVDDELVLCEVVGRMLETGGYRVILANSGKQALDIYSRQHQDIDLIVLDIIMPDMDGKKVYERLKKIHAKVKVLIASGYSKAGQGQTMLADGAKGFLQKPFERTDMLYKVREVLDAT